MTKYRTSWQQIMESMNESQTVFVARWTSKQDGKRYASPFKTKPDAEKRAKELKSQGNRNISVTQDTLRPHIKWKKDGSADIKGMQEEVLDEAVSKQIGYTVKFANSKGAKIASAWYKDEKSAKEALDSIRKNGGNGIISKGKMNEETELDEAVSKQKLDTLKRSWASIKKMTPSKINDLKKFLEKQSSDVLLQLSQYGINFVSHMATSVLKKRKPGSMAHAGSHKTYDLKMSEAVTPEKNPEAKFKDARDDIAKSQQELDKLDKSNPDNRQQVELGQKEIEVQKLKLKQDISKEKEKQLTRSEQFIEQIEGLKKKAEKSGMPYSILKQVYNRGMAAWKGGHRPGTTPQQWAFARVNSFITKSSGTWGKADSDLADKVRGSKD